MHMQVPHPKACVRLRAFTQGIAPRSSATATTPSTSTPFDIAPTALTMHPVCDEITLLLLLLRRLRVKGTQPGL